MDKKTKEQMAKMVDALQPHCDEQIAAAMTCSLSGSMSSLLVGGLVTQLISMLQGRSGRSSQSVKLPNPVFIAVGSKSIYAFDFKPRGFNYKIKKEVARWPSASNRAPGRLAGRNERTGPRRRGVSEEESGCPA